MLEWDSTFNSANRVGYLTVYSTEYDDGLNDFQMKFIPEEMDHTIRSLKTIIHDAILDHNPEELEDIDLVGMNSNSFTARKDKHNIFMEWDKYHYVPNMSELSAFGGMLVETQNGIHLIKEENIDLSNLISMMRHYNCCPGFTDWSERRGYACLRLCPKGDNKLKVIKEEDGFLYSVYKEFISKLE